MKNLLATLCAYTLFALLLTHFVLLAAPFYILFGAALYGSWVVFGIVLLFTWLVWLGGEFIGRKKASIAPVLAPIPLKITGAKSG